MLNPSKRLVEVVNVRLTEADYKAVVATAKADGAATLGAWVRDQIVKATVK